MSGALGSALAFAESQGRAVAVRQLPAISRRVGGKVRRSRRRFAMLGAVALVFVAVLVLVARPLDSPAGEVAMPVAPSSSVALGVDSLLASAVPRHEDQAQGPGQEAVVCSALRSDDDVQVCDAVWVAEDPVIDVSGTTLGVGADGSARISWELRNVARDVLNLDLRSLVVVVIDDSSGEEAPAPVASATDGTTVAVGGSWWADAASRYTMATRLGLPAVVARAAVVSGSVTVPAGSIDPDSVPRVLLQVAMSPIATDGSLLVIEATTPAVTSANAIGAILADARPRLADHAPSADLPVLRCSAAAGATDRLDDRWGDGYLWAPTCAPLWISAPVVTDVSVRSDLDRSPFTRVVRWSARNASGHPLAVDLGATTVVLELEPAVAPRAARLWATSGDGFARIDTLWRAADARTAAIRGPDSELVLVGPGETVSGSANLHFPHGDEAQTWGDRLEYARATVHVVLRGAGIGDDVLVLELVEP